MEDMYAYRSYAGTFACKNAKYFSGHDSEEILEV